MGEYTLIMTRAAGERIAKNPFDPSFAQVNCVMDKHHVYMAPAANGPAHCFNLRAAGGSPIAEEYASAIIDEMMLADTAQLIDGAILTPSPGRG